MPVRVQEDEACSPSAIDLGGVWSGIASIEDVWEIVDEWWRHNQIDRRYHRVILKNGVVVTIFREMTSGVWYRQRV